MSVNITRVNDWKGTKLQERALAYAVREITDARPGEQTAAGHDIVFTIKVEGTDYGTAFVTIHKDIPTLGETNLLRVLESMDSWFITIGKRGALTANYYPMSMKQFKGKSWCGINIQ